VVDRLLHLKLKVHVILTSFLDNDLVSSHSNRPPDLTLTSHGPAALREIRGAYNLGLLSRPALSTSLPTNSVDSVIKFFAVTFDLHLADICSYPSQVDRLVA